MENSLRNQQDNTDKLGFLSFSPFLLACHSQPNIWIIYIKYMYIYRQTDRYRYESEKDITKPHSVIMKSQKEFQKVTDKDQL